MCSVVTERLRYAPLGWSKRFEFNETDLMCALDTVDFWVDLRSAGRANLSPDKIPWTAIRNLLGMMLVWNILGTFPEHSGNIPRLFRDICDMICDI